MEVLIIFIFYNPSERYTDLTYVLTVQIENGSFMKVEKFVSRTRRSRV